MNVSLYDSTLRDGTQGEGISFSEGGKCKFAHLLDDFGVDFIEGGFAGSNPKDCHFFETIRREPLRHAQVVAFGSTRRVDLDAEKDPQLSGLLQADTQWVCIYGKAWTLHVTDVLRTTLDNNLQIIADSVGFLKNQDRQIFFDAEHFFDGYRENPAYALKVLETAIREGVAGIVLCDTNGGSLPYEIFTATQAVIDRFPNTRVAIHTHNDNGMAVANAIEAVRAGARMVQGCINGYGERAGNADLTTIAPILELKMGINCVGKARLTQLRKLSLVTDDLTNMTHDPHRPYVGRSAFSHKAGTHANAILKNTHTFEHVDPVSVGNERHILISELSGISNVLMKARELGEDLSDKKKSEIREVVNELKRLEDIGYSYESADASFTILLHKVLKRHTARFEFDGFRVIVEKRGRDEPCISEATIKVKVHGETELTAGEGSGPVDALNEALRKALTRFYPEIKDVSLRDYRVRILDPDKATQAITRVLVESGDKNQQWSTVGVSKNIIEASWQALLDSVEFKLLSRKEEPCTSTGSSETEK